MKVYAEKIEGRYLQVGDLYSEHGPEYWNNTIGRGIIGVEVMLCCDDPDPTDDEIVYRLMIEDDPPPKPEPKPVPKRVTHTPMPLSRLLPPGVKLK